MTTKKLTQRLGRIGKASPSVTSRAIADSIVKASPLYDSIPEAMPYLLFWKDWLRVNCFSYLKGSSPDFPRRAYLTLVTERMGVNPTWAREHIVSEGKRMRRLIAQRQNA